MSREYIAFISYRHLPREMAVAVRLQKLIERFVIPRDLRRDGEKHLGAVFRDQSELSASSDLSKEICDALDHSQFLIVICSPETKQSEWCRREVQYFLQKHDAEHVLTVLVKGEWWESLPDELIDLRDAGGEVVDHAEPLSANVVAGSKWECMRKLQKEYLRLIAPILGCPYARLNERMRRYRQSVRLAVGTAALAVVTAFACVVWKKNQDIAAQYTDVQIRESRFLSQLANDALEDNDRLKAINIALAALPSEERDRMDIFAEENGERVTIFSIAQLEKDVSEGSAAPYCTLINQIDLNTGEITTFTLAGAFVGGAQVGDCYYAMSMHLDDEEAYESDQITLTKFIISEGESWADIDHVAWQKEIQLEKPADRNSYLYNSDSMNPRYPVIIASNEPSEQNGSNESMIIVGMNTQIMYLNADSGDLIQDYRGKSVLSLASGTENTFVASDDGTISSCTSSVSVNYLQIGQNIQKFCLALHNRVVAVPANSNDILVFVIKTRLQTINPHILAFLQRNPTMQLPIPMVFFE